MAFIWEVLVHTPVWVWLLLAGLIWLGWKSSQPGSVSLIRLALIPAALTAWGIYELLVVFVPTPFNLLLWGAGLAIGFGIGSVLVRLSEIRVREGGKILKPADRTALPLILLAFLIKYALAVYSAITPHAGDKLLFVCLVLTLGGLFAGIFIGKLGVFVRAYLAGPRGQTAL